MQNDNKIEPLLEEVIKRKASDLHLQVGLPPMLRVDGKLMPHSSPVLTEESVEQLVFAILDEEQKEILLKDKEFEKLENTYKEQIKDLVETDSLPGVRVLKQVIQKYIVASKKILFEGDGYSEAWHKEAEKRGLPNLKTTNKYKEEQINCCFDRREDCDIYASASNLENVLMLWQPGVFLGNV